MQTEIDGALESAGRNLSISLFRSGSGVISRRASISSNTVTLTDPQDIVAFENGMTLGASATDGGGSTRTGSAKVVAIDRSNGTLTLDNAAGIASFANNDYLFVVGDYDKSLKGFAAWLPMVAPTSGDNFFGVDRSKDVTRLAGVRFDGSALPINEALQKGASVIAREGGKVDTCVMNFDNYAELEIALGAKVQYIEYKVGELGFQAMRINGPRGTIKVIADQDCQSDRAYMLKLDTWKLYSIGPAVKILELDDNKTPEEEPILILAVPVSAFLNVTLPLGFKLKPYVVTPVA